MCSFAPPRLLQAVPNVCSRIHIKTWGHSRTEIELTRSGDVITAKTKKQRDLSWDKVFSYTLKSICIGEDEDGDTVTSAVVREVEPGKKAIPLSAQQSISIGTRIGRHSAAMLAIIQIAALLLVNTIQVPFTEGVCRESPSAPCLTGLLTGVVALPTAIGQIPVEKMIREIEG